MLVKFVKHNLLSGIVNFDEFQSKICLPEMEGCPILSNRVYWKMGHNNSIDSIDLSNGEFLYSIGKVQLSIGLLHIISETSKNIAVVEGPHKLLSIRSICQMENSYVRLEKSSFPLDSCISLARLRKISP